MFELNPFRLVKSCTRDSRFLRVLFVISCLSWIMLAVALAIRPLSLYVGLILYGFHLGSWYFALATRSAFAFLMQMDTSRPTPRIATFVDQLCQAVIFFCQILFLMIIFRLLEAT